MDVHLTATDGRPAAARWALLLCCWALLLATRAERHHSDPPTGYTYLPPSASDGPAAASDGQQQLQPLPQLLVTTPAGQLQGGRRPAAGGRGFVDAWLAVPYARPPLGRLRFRAPYPQPPWRGARPALRPPHSCWQVRDEFFGDFAGAQQWNPNTPLSEDCLYLSVTRPSAPDDDGQRPPRAVMVWIYGGGFYSGTSTLQAYDPAALASEGDVVVVAVQYRVGSLGFLRLADKAPGNMGLLDQLLALDWVQNNIVYFGGDPQRITLFGNSAGAASISLHMLSPLSASLFRRAVLQSGAATAPWATVSVREANRRALKLAEAVDCPASPPDAAIECLRNVQPDKLVNSEYVTTDINEFPFLPVVDGVFLPEPPTAAVRHGHVKRVDLLAGSTSHEGNYFLFYYLHPYMDLAVTPNVTEPVFDESVRQLFPRLSAATQQLLRFEYTDDWQRPADAASRRDALDRMVGDRDFTCPVTQVAAANARLGGATYMYQLQQRAPQSQWPRWAGVLHADEVFYVFGQALREDRPYTEAEVALTRRIIRYWTNFAKTGDPNRSEEAAAGPAGREQAAGAADGPATKGADAAWPPFEAETQRYLILGGGEDAPSTGRALRARYCALWSDVLPAINAATVPCV